MDVIGEGAPNTIRPLRLFATFSTIDLSVKPRRLVAAQIRTDEIRPHPVKMSIPPPSDLFPVVRSLGFVRLQHFFGDRWSAAVAFEHLDELHFSPVGFNDLPSDHLVDLVISTFGGIWLTW